MNLGEKYFLIFISTFMLYALSSCTTIKNNVDIVDLGDNYEVKYKKDDARNKVFYNQLNGKKLNGYFKGNLRGENYTFPRSPKFATSGQNVSSKALSIATIFDG